MRGTEQQARTRVLAVADSDSYVKLSAAMTDVLPPDRFAVEHVGVRTPLMPSADQARAALDGTRIADRAWTVKSALGVRELVRRMRPDVVMLNCTGPVADLLAHLILGAKGGPRPVLVAAMPGISIPATDMAWLNRGRIDLFVLHSRREVTDFKELGERLGLGGEVGLARLPFLPDPRPRAAVPDKVVFAAQATVPGQKEHREQILVALAGLAEKRPDLDVVVKLRGLESEAQTHAERHHYQALWHGLVRSGRVAADAAVQFRTGAMADHLESSVGLVTVSSTAALEAIALDVPIAVLTDFGISGKMINTVFEGSGTYCTLDDLRAACFHRPFPEWTERNYFHRPQDNDWIDVLDSLVERGRAGGLPTRPDPLAGPARRRLRSRYFAQMTLPLQVAKGADSLRRRLSALRRRLRRALRANR